MRDVDLKPFNGGSAPLLDSHSDVLRDVIERVASLKVRGRELLANVAVHNQEIAQKIYDGLLNFCSVGYVVTR